MTKKLISSSLIFTDLDGTLLNHDNYSFEDASHMLGFIKTNNIPLIIVTSKTKNEVMQIQKKLAISTPFIVENGGGVIFPKEEGHDILALGYSYQEIRSFFQEYATIYNIRGFGDMEVQEVMELTDLPHEQAREAKERLFSEPFVLENESDFVRLKQHAKKDGLDIVKGGRFNHLITLGQDKSVAVKKLIEFHENNEQKPYHSIALGDSANDLEMLKAVDTAILIPHLDGSYLECDIDNLIKAKESGALGWNNTLKEYFDA